MIARHWRTVVLGGVASLIVILAAGAVALGSQWGTRFVLTRVARAATSIQDLTIETGDIRGSRFTSLTITDLRVRLGDSIDVLSLDTLRMSHQFRPLFSRRFVVGSLRLVRPILDLRACVGGAALQAMQATPAQRPWTSLVGEVGISGGRAMGGGCDDGESWRIEDLNADASGVSVAAEVAGRLRTLRMRISPSGESEGYVADLSVSGELRRGILSIDSLSLQSPSSDVVASGLLRMPTDSSAASDIDFHVRAEPLAFRDLQPFTAALVEDGTVRIDARLRGSAGLLDVEGRLELPDGGEARVVAAMTPGDVDSLRYRGRAAVTGLDPTLVFVSAPAGVWNGTVEVDLEGPSLAELGGTFDVDLHRAAAAGAGTGARLTAELSAGQAEVSGELYHEDKLASFGGLARPFADPREAEMEGEARWSPGDRSASGDEVGGRFALALTGNSLTTASGRVDFTLSPSSFRGLAIPRATLSLELESGAGTWNAASSLDGGTLSASGAVRLQGVPELRVDSALIRDLDVVGLLGGDGPSQVNGTVVGVGRGGVRAARGGTATVNLGRSVFGSMVVDTAALGVALEGERLDVDFWAGALGGTVAGALRADVGDGVGIELTRGTFRGLDLSGAGDRPRASSDLTGSVSGRWATGSPGSSGRISVALAPSRLQRLALDTGTVDVRLSGDTLDISAMVVHPEGRLSLLARHDASGERPTWDLQRMDFTGLDLALLSESGGIQSRLAGHAEASISGAALSAATGSVSLSLDPSRVGRSTVRVATLEGTLIDGRSDWVATIEADGAAADLQADVDLRGGGAEYHGQGGVRIDDLGQAVRSENLTGQLEATFDFEGEGLARDSLRASLSVRSLGGHVQGVELDSASVSARVASGFATIDTLQLWSEALMVEGRGQAPLNREGLPLSHLSVIATAHTAGPLREWMGWDIVGLGTARAAVVVESAVDSLALTLDISVSDLLHGSAQVDEMAGSGQAFLSPTWALSSVSAQARVNGTSSGNLSVRRMDVAARSEGSDGEAFSVSGDAVIDDDRSGDFKARVGFGEATTEVGLTALNLDLLAQRWTLERDAVLRFGDGVEIQDFMLTSPTGRIAAEGIARTSGAQSLAVDVGGLQLGGISDILGYGRLEGTADATLRLTGTAADPSFRATLSAQATLPDLEPATLTAEVRYDSLRLVSEGSIRQPQGQEATLSAMVPMHVGRSPSDSAAPLWRVITTEPLRVDLSARRLALTWLSPLLGGSSVTGLSGTLDADTRAEGTADELSLSGTISLAEAGASLTALGIELRDGSLAGHLEQDRFVVDGAQVSSGDGRLVASGTIRARDLGSGELDLGFRLNDFLAIRSEYFRAVVDGELTLTGTTESPRLDGAVDVLRGDVSLGGRFAGTRAETVQLTEADYQMLAERFAYRPPTGPPAPALRGRSALSMGVDIRVGRDVWVRQRANPTLSVQFTGDLRVDKEPGRLESVVGSLEALPRNSYVRQFGRRFSLTQGRVDFNGPVEGLQVDVDGSYRVPSRGDPGEAEVVIGLGVEGGLSDWRLVLSSEPELQNADIVSYLATGRPASETLQFDSPGGGRVLDLGATLALGRATSTVEELGRERVGLDVMEIRTEGVSGPTLVAGRYVSPRLYLGFKQPVTLRRNEASTSGRGRSYEVEIEYQAYRWLLLNLQRGGSRIEFFLRSRYAY